MAIANARALAEALEQDSPYRDSARQLGTKILALHSPSAELVDRVGAFHASLATGPREPCDRRSSGNCKISADQAALEEPLSRV